MYRPISIFVLVLILGSPALAQSKKNQEKVPPPRNVTEITLQDAAALAALQKPGKIVFHDDFESEDSWKKYFEVRGRKEKNAEIIRDAKTAHRGKAAIRFTARPKKDGGSAGAGASAWLGDRGYDRLYYRRYIKFAKDYDQGNLNHTGGGLAGVASSGKWDGMGKAGIKPDGDDRFTSGFEPWKDWGRYESPGYMFLYTYWMEMEGKNDGRCWGNMLQPAKKRRIVPKLGEWVCIEQMIKVNRVGHRDGELAAWIDGKLYLHFKDIRWRRTERLKIKRFDFGIYIHESRKKNVVWYDDVAVSTGYIGPIEKKKTKSK